MNNLNPLFLLEDMGIAAVSHKLARRMSGEVGQRAQKMAQLGKQAAKGIAERPTLFNKQYFGSLTPQQQAPIRQQMANIDKIEQTAKSYGKTAQNTSLKQKIPVNTNPTQTTGFTMGQSGSTLTSKRPASTTALVPAGQVKTKIETPKRVARGERSLLNDKQKTYLRGRRVGRAVNNATQTFNQHAGNIGLKTAGAMAGIGTAVALPAVAAGELMSD